MGKLAAYIFIGALIVVAFWLFVLFLEYAVALFIKALLRHDLRRRSRGKLALSFDDGPGQRLEPKLLDFLEKHAASATFFLNAKRAEAHPERCAVLAHSCHELGCHAYDHLNPWRVPPWKAIADIGRAYKVLEKWVDNKACMRFAFGRFTTSMWLLMRLRGRKVVYWTVDSGDTCPKLPEADQVVQNVARNNGGVVIMHSFDRAGDTDREGYVLQLTEKLLEMAKVKNMSICTCGELLK
ncbi:MAG: polysaccharide deacetylase family protein [Planctomycetota bacterium]|jgi:peptidoglycan/xylan/chitin deacetylase (PgdA/CDA1 family)